MSFQQVVLALQHHGRTRRVAVLVGSGRNWYEATRFPHVLNEEGASSGDDVIDRLIRQRAAEELIRLQAAVEALGGTTTEELR